MASNEIDDLISSAERFNQEKLGLSTSYALKKNPEQSANVYNFSQSRGLPLDYTERNFEKLQTPDFEKVGPTVAQLLKDRHKAPITIDDIDNLSWWETTGRELGNVAKLAPSSAYSVSSSGYAILGNAFNVLSALSLAPVRGLGLATEEEIQRQDILGKAGQYMMSLSQNQALGVDEYMPKKTIMSQAVVGGIRSAIINIPALAAGVVTRNPNVSLGIMGGVTYGDSYLRAKEAGLGELSATTYAANQTLAEVSTEKLPAFKLLEDIGANAGFFKMVAAQLALEIPGEQVATIWQDAIDWATLNPDKTLQEFADERKDAAIDTLVSTVVAAGLQTTAVAGIDKLGKKKEQDALQEISDKATESKVRGRVPEIFAEHVQAVADEYGSPDAVYIDAKEARALFQNLSKDEGFDLIAAQIDEAEAIGGDIVIPIGEFAAKVAASSNFSALKDIVRLSPESPTNSQITDQPQRIMELLAEANKNVATKTRADSIYKDISAQLIATGRMDASSAKASATLIPAYVATMAERSGMTADEVYGMMGLKVVGPGAEVGGAKLEQSDLQRALSMTEDEYIAAINPTGKKIDSEDRMILHEGEIDLPVGAQQIASFNDKSGVQVYVHEDQSGVMYAVRGGNVVGYMGPLEANETVIDVVDEAKGSGVGKGLAAEFIKKDPFAQSGGFTPAGEANRRSAFRAIKAAAGESLRQESRAEIFLLPTESIIKLGEASDLTSFLHEAGHLFLDMEGKLYSNPNATEQIKADGDLILKWLGVDSFDQLKDYVNDDKAREAHEKFARGFEKYLGEGKAPSIELKSVFRRFAAWIKQVYLDARKLNVELTDEIRGVMDRMLATDEAINRVKNNFNPLFSSAEDAVMTQAEYKAYSSNASPDAAKEVLLAKMTKQIKRQYTKWWKEESASIAVKVGEKLLDNPLYLATENLKGNHKLKGLDNPKLNKNIVRAFLGEVTSKFRGMVSDDGMGADELASIYGFSSGEELIDVIENSPTYQQEIRRQTEQEMLSKHGDILNDGTIEEEAQQAIRSPEHGKKLIAELAALSRKSGKQSIDREAIKAYAQKVIGSMPYTRIRPETYRAAEVRAARAAVSAKNRGDMALAHKIKTQEIVNYYLAKEAAFVKDKSEKIRSAQKAIQTRKYTSSSIDTDYVNQAKVLLAAFDFRKSSADSRDLAAARLSSVRNWIESQQLNPDNVATFVKADILGKLIPYKEMTFDELSGLNDTVSSILHAGRQLAEADKIEYRKDMETGIETIKANRIDTYETEVDTHIPWVQAKNLFDQATAGMRKLESLARQADGMNDQGWVWKHTVKPLLDAAHEKLRRMDKASTELEKIFHGFNGAFSSLKDIRKFTLDSGRSIRLSYGSRISIALNLGNEGNLEALKTMDKLPMTDNDIANIVGTLSEADWGLVQNIWDYIDTYWVEIAELEKKRSGVAPQKVQPRPFVTTSGIDMKGGYYPLAGDSAYDSKQLDQDLDTQASAMMNGGAASKSTKHGSTIERVGFGGKKIDFSVNVLFNHIDGVIHDITHWQAVKDVDRVLRNKKVTAELSTSLGNPGVQAMKQRLKEVAAGPQRLEGLGWINRILRHARLASTYSALGYSVRTAAMNMLGITTAIADMNTKQVAAATMQYYGNLSSTNKMILDKSEYMRDRGMVLNRDIAQIRAHLRGDNAFTKFREYAFWMMTQTDKAITRPIWLAAYNEGMVKFATEQEAIDHADRMVARTQGSGMDMDLANVETRSEVMKTMTVMYTAFSAIYNIAAEQQKRYKAGKISTAELAMKIAWLTVIPGILTQLLTGSDDDEPDEYVWEVAGQGLGMIPLARDAYSFARYGSSFPTPILRLLSAPVKFIQQARQGEIDKGLIGAASEVASWAHIPGGAQLTRTYGYIAAMQDGEVEEFSPIDLLITGKE